MAVLKTLRAAVVASSGFLLAVVFVLPLSAPCHAQKRGSAASKSASQPSVLPRVLQPTSTKLLSVPRFSYSGVPLSDDSGNLYFRPAADNDQLAIFKLSPQDEGNSKMFEVPSGTAEADYFDDYCVTPSGTLYILAQDVKRKFHVLSFDSDGQVKHNERLETPDYALVIDFAVFENGTILATGYYERDAPGPIHGKSYAALFDQSGQLLRDMTRRFSLEDASSEPNGPLTHISIRPGKDGNLYLLGSSSVLVVSPGGEVVQGLKFVKPDPESVAIDLEVSQGLLLIELGDKPAPGKRVNPRYLVLDASSGKRYGYYRASDEIKGMLGHFSSKEGLTFVTSEKGYVKLVTAAMN
jgi:hypothetical protein